MNRVEPIPSSTLPDRLIGTTINGRYRITGTIGVGGMGRVYRAEQLPLGRSVALKVLHVRSHGREISAELPNLEKRFFREASVLSRLEHPNIVTIYDYGAIEGAVPGSGQYFIAMEYLAGSTLAERTADGPMAIPSAVRIATQIAHALEEAHAQGIVHRDLKPSNVMLVTGRRGEERAKLIDFGVVKLVGDEQAAEQLTLNGDVVGSPKYMAPEQLVSAHTLDRRADVWALGVVLYRMLTGRAAFQGETTGWLIHDVLNGPAPRVQAERPDAPPELDEIVARCLEKSPSKRFSTMGDVAAALDALGIEGAHVASDASRSGAGGRASGSRRVREGMISTSTLLPESLVAISTRGTSAAKRREKLAFALIGAGAIAIVAAVSTRRLGALASPDVSAPTIFAATGGAPPPATLAGEAPAHVELIPTRPSPTVSALPSASALSPGKPNPRTRPPTKRPVPRDDDIPAVR